MIQFFIFSICTLLASQTTTVVRGKIIWNNEPMPGWTVRVNETDHVSLSDFNGEFIIEVENHRKSYDLEATYIDGSMSASTKIVNVPIHGDTLNLGDIPVFYNEIIGKPKYRSLTGKEKNEYQRADVHRPDAGYIHKKQIDTSKITLPCTMGYRYNLSDNEVTLDFKEVIKCHKSE